MKHEYIVGLTTNTCTHKLYSLFRHGKISNITIHVFKKTICKNSNKILTEGRIFANAVHILIYMITTLESDGCTCKYKLNLFPFKT